MQPSVKPARLEAILRSLVLMHCLTFLVSAGGCVSTYLPKTTYTMGDVSLLATHSPMHPKLNENTTFSVQAYVRVDKITISYVRYALSRDKDGNLEQGMGEPSVLLKTCDKLLATSNASCFFTTSQPLPNSSLIEFRAEGYQQDGKKLTDVYSFSAGDFPIPNEPIPIRFKGADFEKKIDIVLIPGQGVTDIRSKLNSILEKSYFKYKEFLTWRGLYNFYYTPSLGGEYREECIFKSPEIHGELSGVADALVILHEGQQLRDCSKGLYMSSELEDDDKSLIHESGHVLFDLQDEYCCDSHYEPQSCFGNIWSSLSSCNKQSAKLGLPASSCEQLRNGTETRELWHIDHGGPNGCIMGSRQHDKDSKFGKACTARIEWRYQQCLDGGCYHAALQECP